VVAAVAAVAPVPVKDDATTSSRFAPLLFVVSIICLAVAAAAPVPVKDDATTISRFAPLLFVVSIICFPSRELYYCTVALASKTVSSAKRKRLGVGRARKNSVA
jgi:hypothetical protein